MSHISLDTSDNVPRQAFREKIERVKELEAENERLTAKNKALRKVFDAAWDALDGLYGADMGEVIPVTLLPEDRQQLFNRVLDVVGETGVMDMLEEH